MPLFEILTTRLSRSSQTVVKEVARTVTAGGGVNLTMEVHTATATF